MPDNATPDDAAPDNAAPDNAMPGNAEPGNAMSDPVAAAESDGGFAFGADDSAAIDAILARYPRRQSAALPLLMLAQRRCGGSLTMAALAAVAKILETPPVRLYELATFYSMMHLEPTGRFRLYLCRSLSCWLRGCDQLLALCRDQLNISEGQVSADGLFSLHPVECLGACVNAPVLCVNQDYYEDLSVDALSAILAALKRGAPPPAGSMKSRRSSEPVSGLTCLKSGRAAPAGSS